MNKRTIPLTAPPKLTVKPTINGILQRACACGQHTPGGGECAECKKKRIGLQRQAVSRNGPQTAPPIVYEVLHSAGQPLNAVTRADMELRFSETRFGHNFIKVSDLSPHSTGSGLQVGAAHDHFEQEANRSSQEVILNTATQFSSPLPPSPRFDFSRVRVHTGEKAAESARAVNALAYTVGEHIVFGAGQYAPGTLNGQQILSHELAHTVQQAGGSTAMRVQRMIPCPQALAYSDPVPAGFKAYHGNSCWFHCCYRGILEDRTPSPDDPQNECFYDDNGVLVDENHEDAGCRGTPNQYDSASDWWSHTFEDQGGIWAKGWGAFWASRWRDLNQHFEREGQRIMDCHEICNEQPWYLRGFCLQGCSGTVPMP